MKNANITAVKPPQVLPIGNYAVILLMSVIFAMQFLGDPSQKHLTGLILNQPSFMSVSGYSWLHTGPLHIISNIVLLAVFGRAASIKLGPSRYILSYFALGIAAAFSHLIFDARPVIGSSGAISGILGMAIVLSWNKLSPFAPWIILTWFILSLSAAVAFDTPVAHIAHMGGFIAGMFLAVAMIYLDKAEKKDTDRNLLEILKKTVPI